MALLTVMGCDMVQGFLISRPIDLDALLHFLDDDKRRRSRRHVACAVQPAWRRVWKRALMQALIVWIVMLPLALSRSAGCRPAPCRTAPRAVVGCDAVRCDDRRRQGGDAGRSARRPRQGAQPRSAWRASMPRRGSARSRMPRRSGCRAKLSRLNDAEQRRAADRRGARRWSARWRRVQAARRHAAVAGRRRQRARPGWQRA